MGSLRVFLTERKLPQFADPRRDNGDQKSVTSSGLRYRNSPGLFCWAMTERKNRSVIASEAKQSVERGGEGMRSPCVTIIMASGRNGTLYTGVTPNLLQRTHQHREGFLEGFGKL
jgi:hypothetical protein